MAPDGITDGWLSAALNANVRVGEVSRIGDGLVGMNLRIGVLGASADGPHAVIAKLPSLDPTSRATGIALRNYEREVCFYRDLAPTVDIRVAHCYHSELDVATGDFVLLLEDLSPAAQGDQITGCASEHAHAAVLELARLHGPRWGDATLDEIEWLSRRSPEDVARLGQLWEMFLPGFMTTYRPYLTVEGAELIERFGLRLPDWLDDRLAPSTVTHGDYRLDNLMFATADGGAPIATVDWQTPGHGPATADVSYFLGAGPLPTVRREIERELVDEYGQALAGYGVHVDGDELWRQYRREAYAGIVMSVIASQIVGVSARSEAMFAAMAERHTQHALDLDAESLL